MEHQISTIPGPPRWLAGARGRFKLQRDGARRQDRCGRDGLPHHHGAAPSSCTIKPEPEPDRAINMHWNNTHPDALADAGAADRLPLVLGRGLFADNATGLRQAIHKCTNRSRLLGYSVVIMGLDRPPAGRPYIVYQLEQLRSEMINDEFTAVLKNAEQVWDFSILHADHWTEFGLPGRHMPLWYTLPRSVVSPPTAPAATVDVGEQIDVLLFGSMNSRREIMGSLLEDAGLRVVFKRFTDFDEQQDCIRRAAIVANIHYHTDAALEVHRIDPLLAAGKVVLSEYSADDQLDCLYSDNETVMFAHYDDFVPEAVRLLSSLTRRDAMASAAKSLMWERHSGYPQPLHDALEGLPHAGDVLNDVDKVAYPEPSVTDWTEWASGATGRAQFAAAIDLVRGWAGAENPPQEVECVIPEPGKIGIRLEGSIEGEEGFSMPGGVGGALPHIAAITRGSQADTHGTALGLRVGLVLIAVQGVELSLAGGREEAMAAIVAAGRPLTLRFRDPGTGSSTRTPR